MANVSSWTEGIIFTLAFLAILSIVVVDFNINYGQTNSVDINDNTTENLFIEYQNTSQRQIKGGEVEFDAQQGISLKSSYGLVTDAMSIVWSFLSGGFIEAAINSWNLGAAGTILAKAMRIIWFLSAVFALLYALFKTKV